MTLPCRRHRRPRCRGCGLHVERCVCDRLPRITLPFDFLLVQHHVEDRRPTNTGRILQTMVPGPRILVYGRKGHPLDSAALEDPARDYLLLFPRPGSAELTRGDLGGCGARRRTLVLPDGSWGQASNMARRIAPLACMRAVHLPSGPPSEWTLRHADDPRRVSTLEAGIRVVALAGRAADARRMLEGLRLVHGEMRRMKGLKTNAECGTRKECRLPISECRRGP